MAYSTKVATCCYCGTKAALVLRGKTRHELSCSQCGAPLHDLKMLPKEKSGDKELVKPSRTVGFGASKPTKPRKAKKKKRKSFFKRFEDVFDDAFDVIEDIFD